MKKIIQLILFFYCGVIAAQVQSKDTARYDYIGIAMDSTLYAGNIDYINQLFDKTYILNQVIVKSDDSYVKNFNKGFESGLMQSFNYGKIITNELGDTGSFDFLRSRINEKGEYHLLFRLSGDEGLNYHDYKLKEVEGEVKIVDVYFFMSGEYLSKTLKDGYNAALSNKPNIITKLLKKTVADDFVKVLKIKNLLAEQKYQEAYKLYKTISSEIRKQKSLQLVGMQVAYYIDDATYQKEIEKYEKSFPNDPSLYLISIDGAFLKGNYDRVLNLIRKLDKAIGGDPYLDSFRANVFFAKGELETAMKYANQMLGNYPFYVESYTTKLSILVEQKNFKSALETLNSFYSMFGLEKQDMDEAMAVDYPELIKSSEYKEWLKQK